MWRVAATRILPCRHRFDKRLPAPDTGCYNRVMPMYEYECRGCGRRFEFLTREGRTPECPSCHGADLQKLLSTFAAHAGGAGSATKARESMPCGNCAERGSCMMN